MTETNTSNESDRGNLAENTWWSDKNCQSQKSI